MKQKIQLQIAEPCHENWNSMQPADEGRFCLSCQKTVVDFSAMSDAEILRYISTASTGICGRAATDQLQRTLKPSPGPRKTWWKYCTGMVASLLIIMSKSDAQTKTVKTTVISVPQKSKTDQPAMITMGRIASVRPVVSVADIRIPIIVRGKIKDENYSPVPYATISCADGDGIVAADSTGMFVLHTRTDVSNLILAVSSVGYSSKTSVVEAKESSTATVMKKEIIIDIKDIVLTSTSLDSIIVTRNMNLRYLTGNAGAVSVSRKINHFEKIKNSVKEVIGTNEIKIYPNPVAANSMFSIRFNIKEPGEYFLQFVDVAGRIVSGKPLNIPSKNYTESFNGNMFSAQGTYFVRVTGRQNGKGYTTKLVVQ